MAFYKCIRQHTQILKLTSIIPTASQCMCTSTIHKTTNYESRDNNNKTLEILGIQYPMDSKTNITPRIHKALGQNLHNQRCNPLNLLKERIKKHMYMSFVKPGGNPIFSVFDNISPVVTLEQNFDSLMVPLDHPSRIHSESYYINKDFMLRAHTSAHQRDLLQMGFDAFMVFGDVYRRDHIDKSHYFAFHQAEGVRCFTIQQVFENVRDSTNLTLFEKGKRTHDKQAAHTIDCSKLIEHDLKQTLSSLAYYLFGKDIETQWVEASFPFTHPSWELEIKYQNEWLEVLGCGIVEQEILDKAGANTKVGWAFGLGLERLAMKLYDIPDIRIFWSNDAGVLSQFDVSDPDVSIKYKPVSVYPPCTNDISFWVPDNYQENDFYDIVRDIGGEYIEQVRLFDTFFHPKKQQKSCAYHIVYRSMERTLNQVEVNAMHSRIQHKAETLLGVTIRDK